MTQDHNTVNQPGSDSHGDGPFDLRTVVLLLVAAVIGIVIGWLTYLAGQPVPAAVAAGLLAGGGSLVAAHQLIKHR